MSLKIRQGQRVALWGESGSGKSLFLDILFGLREPTGGMVSVNGIDPRDLRPDVLRRKVALARDVEVFDGTIAENVHLERPDISIADVRNALELVGLLGLIQKLPEGLETALTASGSPLTTSQLRRMMVARAIAGHPEIVLIDEVLDSLSDHDAAQILSNILSNKFSWTVVLVTNREQLKQMMDFAVELAPDGAVRTEMQPGGMS